MPIIEPIKIDLKTEMLRVALNAFWPILQKTRILTAVGEMLLTIVENIVWSCWMSYLNLK